jgi:gas vesicle protein
MREEGEYGAGGMFLSFLLGGIVGAAFALLLAPQSGRETRTRIRELTEDVKGRAKDYAVDVKDKVTSSIEKGKGLYEEKKSAITKAVEAGKDAYDKEKERLAKE